MWSKHRKFGPPLRQWNRRLVWFILGLLVWLGLYPLSLLGWPSSVAIARTPQPLMDLVQVNPEIAGLSKPETVVQEQNSEIQGGLKLYKDGYFVQALRQWQRDAQTFHQTQQFLKEALVLNYLALTYRKLGQNEAAQQSITQGLQLLLTPAIQAPKSELQSVLARLLNTQGSLQLAQGKADLALESWQKATRSYHQLGDRIGEVGSLINQSQAEQSLGYFVRAQSTLDLARQLLPKQTDVSLRLIMTLNLGQVLTRIGDFEKAQAILVEAQLIAEKKNLREKTALIMIQQGNLAYTQKKYEPAINHYRKALDFTNNPATQLEANLNRLRVLIAQQAWTEAQVLWPSLKSTLDSLPESHVVLSQRLQLADSLMALQMATQLPKGVEIAQLLTQSAQQAKQFQDLRAESFALGYLGRLYEYQQQWSNARSLTQQALNLAQQGNAPDSRYRWQWQLARILRSQGQTESALTFYQSAVDTLQNLRQDLVSISLDLQYSFRDQIEPVYREYVDLLLQPRQGQSLSLETLKTARDVIESLRLAELDYFLRSSCLDHRRRPLESLIQPGTALLYPIVLNNRIATLLTLPDGSLHLFNQAVRMADLDMLTQQLRTALEKPYTAPESKTLGLELYQLVVKPSEALLQQQQIKTLVFVPDGVLRNIPLAALYDGQRFLIEQYQVAISPGLEIAAPDPKLPSGSLPTLAAGLSESRSGFSPLTFVPQELKAIARAIPVRVLLNDQFTFRAISNAINNSSVKVVHLATHGQFSSDINQTFVLAWDQPITLYDLKALLENQQQPFRKSIDLLVLSACETASGDNRAALGLAGVSVQAGARSTVASLWNIDDQSSSLFMEQFYSALAKPGITKAEALRQTQLQFLKNPDYRHPVHWAAYVLIGNWV